jgi:hypothetical protein
MVAVDGASNGSKKKKKKLEGKGKKRVKCTENASKLVGGR